LTIHKDDLFHVTVFTKNFESNNNIYNFAATAPGTYQVLDFGRFVKSFRALDNSGNEIKTKQISTNRWEIENPEILHKIEYKIEDSFDTDISENIPAPMCGTGIQDEFIVFNTFGVLGYFEELQSLPVRLKVDYLSEWTIGTAMDQDADGYYYAETFDRLADSPILIGQLTTATIEVNDIKVDVLVFNPDSTLYAEKILTTAESVLKSAGKFIGYSPVPYYKFLMVLLDNETANSYGIAGCPVMFFMSAALYNR
jgi:predicted metalloprotease with PDZ domain